MRKENYGQWFESNPITYAVGNHDFDLAFLRSAMKDMVAPCVAECVLHFEGSITGDGVFAGEDAPKMYSRIDFADQHGLFFSLPGTIARVVAQQERGDAFFDAPGVADTVTDAAFNSFLPIYFETTKMRGYRPKDTRVPLLHFISGGSVKMTLQAPPNATVNSGTVRLRVRVVEERQRELKARVEWRERNLTKTEDDYDIGGLLRSLFICSDLSTQGYTSLATGLATVNSKTLEYVQQSIAWLEQIYKKDNRAPHSGDEFDAQNAVSLIHPREGQPLGALPNLDTFNLKVVSIPSNARLVTCTIKPRSGSLAAEWMGAPTVGHLVKAVEQSGKIGGKNGHPAVSFGELGRYLPIRF